MKKTLLTLISVLALAPLQLYADTADGAVTNL